jgi:hypothetical protein
LAAATILVPDPTGFGADLAFIVAPIDRKAECADAVASRSSMKINVDYRFLCFATRRRRQWNRSTELSAKALFLHKLPLILVPRLTHKEIAKSL